MKDLKFEIGDLVKIRDDLECNKKYGNDYFCDDMKFVGFKKIEKLNDFKKTVHIKPNNDSFYYNYTKEMIVEVKRPTKYETIYKREESILDEKEKEYLCNVIRPFRNSVKCIVKYTNYIDECITIFFENNNPIYLPYFKANTMYKKMKVDKSYTLEELGL